MLPVKKQIELQKLVCPRTFQPLREKDGFLETFDGANRYPFIGNAPVLFADVKTQQSYLQENDGDMHEEYTAKKESSAVKSVKNYLSKDFRSKEAIDAYYKLFDGLGSDALCLAIGGGPRRHHPQLVNVNIGAFANVDVIADAYNLPYADGSVDAVYLEAVLEHLEFPEKAVQEACRVLKVGGRVYANTPFMHHFHGYPSHFQNFTIEGHKRLFSRNGFNIEMSGTSVGPTYALFSFLTNYIKEYSSPKILKYPFLAGTYGLSVMLKPIDIWLNKKGNAHYLASGTFIYAVKK
jgi:SAM-dependent methyltransferase